MLCLLHRNHLHSLLTHQLKVLGYPHLKFISTSSEPTDSPCFTTRDYLINSCGLSPQTAQSVAQKVHIKSTSKPNSVLNFFHNHGFSQTQISQIISKYPRLLVAHPEKTLKPKIDFFQSLGFSGSNLTQLISSHPEIFARGLKNQSIIFKYLKSLLCTDTNVRIVIKLSPRILGCNLDKLIVPNVELLRNVGVPDVNIAKFFIYQPRMMALNVGWFKRSVDMVAQFGFDPLSTLFLYAVRGMAGLSEQAWERKLGVYKELGWSKEDTLAMFRKQPNCMTLSEEKIRRAVGFFVNVLKWKPVDISVNPVLIFLSMEKRIVPRCSVLGVLYSAGVFREPPVKRVLMFNEKKFVEKYVSRYQESVPDVLKAYEGKIIFTGFKMAK